MMFVIEKDIQEVKWLIKRYRTLENAAFGSFRQTQSSGSQQLVFSTHDRNSFSQDETFTTNTV
jgi:hypothetical protein